MTLTLPGRVIRCFYFISLGPGPLFLLLSLGMLISRRWTVTVAVMGTFTLQAALPWLASPETKENCLKLQGTAAGGDISCFNGFHTLNLPQEHSGKERMHRWSAVIRHPLLRTWGPAVALPGEAWRGACAAAARHWCVGASPHLLNGGAEGLGNKCIELSVLSVSSLWHVIFSSVVLSGRIFKGSRVCVTC